MKGIKFYSGVNFDGSEMFLGAVLNGVAAVSGYPITHELDLEKIASDMHKHLVESAIVKLLATPTSLQYTYIKDIASAVGMKSRLVWNDVVATEDYSDFKASILAEYRK